MVYIRRVDPNCQIPERGFSTDGVAYLTGDSGPEWENGFVARIRNTEAILSVIELTKADFPTFVLRGRTNFWFDQLRELVEKIEGWQLRWVDNEVSFSFILIGDVERVSLLSGLRWPDWDDCAFGLTHAPSDVVLPGSALVQNDQKFCERFSFPKLEVECVPLFWEGAFAVHSLYVPSEIEIIDDEAGISLLEGFAVVEEIDAMGEGDPAYKLFGIEQEDGMKFFSRTVGLAINGGRLKVQTVLDLYQEHLKAIAPFVPHSIIELANLQGVDDGLIVRVIYNRESHRLTLTLRCGDIPSGYYDLALTYVDAKISREHLGVLRWLAENTTNSQTSPYDLGNHEIDWDPEDGIEHRLLFHINPGTVWFRILCSSIEWKKIPRAGRTLPRLKERFAVV